MQWLFLVSVKRTDMVCHSSSTYCSVSLFIWVWIWIPTLINANKWLLLGITWAFKQANGENICCPLILFGGLADLFEVLSLIPLGFSKTCYFLWSRGCFIFSKRQKTSHTCLPHVCFLLLNRGLFWEYNRQIIFDSVTFFIITFFFFHGIRLLSSFSFKGFPFQINIEEIL